MMDNLTPDPSPKRRGEEDCMNWALDQLQNIIFKLDQYDIDAGDILHKAWTELKKYKEVVGSDTNHQPLSTNN